MGWVTFAIAKVDAPLARQLMSEYIAELRENNFRKGVQILIFRMAIPEIILKIQLSKEYDMADDKMKKNLLVVTSLM